MTGVIEGFLVLACVVLVGYGIGRAGVLGPSATEVLSRTAFFVASPALLFITLANADIAAVFSESLVVTAVTSPLACLLYLPVARLRRRPAGETVIGAMASGYVNAGNLGIPVAVYVFGDAAVVAPVLMFQLAVLTPLLTTALDVVSPGPDGRRPTPARTITAPLRNPLAIATMLGLVVTATGVELPDAVLNPIELLGDLAVPAMLLAFGISLHGSTRPGRDQTLRIPLLAIVLLKNIGHPLLALAFGLVLGLTGTQLLAVVVCAALPAAQNVFGYAVRFGHGVTLARDAVLLTTLGSLPVIFTAVALLL